MARINQLVVFFAMVLLIGLLAACEPRTGTTEPIGKIGKDSAAAAPDFTLATLQGSSIKLSNYRGKIVVLNFWATWCPPCRVEIPDFIAAQKQYKDQGVEFIGVALDERGREVVEPFVQKTGINYTIALADEQVVSKYGGLNSIPTTFFIDRDGNIVRQVVGAVSGDQLEQLMKAMLALSKQ